MTQRQSLVGAHHPDVGRIFGPYRVLSLLGEGDTGLVYLVEHVRLGRKAAIKRIKDPFAGDRETVERFFKEAKTVNRIKHPHIVEYFDFVVEGDVAYYVMELLEGQTVAKALRIEGVFTHRRALHIAYQVADALHAAHQTGVIHGEIKPSNIFLTERAGLHDYVKLLDFGTSRLYSGKAGTGENSTALPAGASAYMSPEQARGDKVAYTSDIYSLGAVIYEMFSGRPPFEADSSAEYSYKHMSVRPITLARLEGLPQRIAPAASRVVMRCLNKDPKDRFASAEELSDYLRKAARSTGILLRPGSMPTVQTMRSSVRKATILATVSILVAVIVLVVSILLMGRSKERAPSSPSEPPARAAKIDRITLTVRTTPSGAEVIRGGLKPQILGLTPLTLNLEKSNEQWRLLIKLDGFETKLFDVVMTADQTLSVELLPDRQRARAGKRVSGSTAPSSSRNPSEGTDPASPAAPGRGSRAHGSRKHTGRKRPSRDVRPRRRQGRGSHGLVDPFG